MAARKAADKETGICLVPGCNNKAQSRGLCWSDLATARAKIASGEVTEDALIKKGVMLARKRLGRPHSTALAKFLDRKRS